MHGFHREGSSLFSRAAGVLVPFVTALIVAYGFIPECFSSLPFQSAELHGHVALTKRLAEFLRHGRLFFYDHWWFSGWSVFSHHPPFPHLISALFSLPLTFFSKEPARLSCHLLTGLSLAGLPFSLFWAARGLLPRGEDGRERGSPFLLGVAASLFATWFLAHRGSDYGLGANTGIELGLLPRLLSWHLLLLYLGLIFRIASPLPFERKEISPFVLAFTIPALLLSDIQTAIFALVFSALILLWRGYSFSILLNHVLGIGLAAFWIIPVSFGATSGLAPKPPAMPAGLSGDFFSLLFRVSPENAVRALFPKYAGSLSLVPIAMMSCFGFLLYPMVRRHRVLLTGLFLTILSVYLLRSDFAAKLSPIPFDSARFLPAAILAFICLLSVIPVLLARGSLPSAVLLSLILIVVQLQEFLLWDSAWPNGIQRSFSAETKILEALAETKSISGGGSNRLYVERPLAGSRKEYSFPYLISTINEETGFEVLNGLFSDESTLSEFTETLIAGLGLNAFPTPIFSSMGNTFTPEELVHRLRHFGVSTILRPRLPENKPIVAPGVETRNGTPTMELISIGPASPTILPAGKRIIGYLDLDGSLPFEVLELVVFSHHDLSATFDLLLLNPDGPLPREVEQILINSSDTERFTSAAKLLSGNILGGERRSSPPIVRRIIFPADPQSDAPEFRPPSAREALRQVAFRARDFFLERGLPQALLESPSGQSPEGQPPVEVKSSSSAEFDWQEQKIQLSGLNTGSLYRLNYTFSPAWVSDEGVIYRGLGERMWFLPSFTEGELRYSTFRNSPALIGLIISFLSLGLLLGIFGSREK